MTFPDALRELLSHPPWLEILANCVNLLSIALATRNSIHTWWTGILGCLLFGWLFYSSQLYAEVTLQVFFIGSSAFGWWHWLHHRGNREERPITRTRPAELALTIPAAAFATLGYGWLLHRFTNAYAPFPDSAILTLSVTAQFLLMRRKVETWGFWFLVNTLAVGVFASRGLWVTAFFYTLFWINAPLGFLRWRRQWRSGLLSPPPAVP